MRDEIVQKYGRSADFPPFPNKNSSDLDVFMGGTSDEEYRIARCLDPPLQFRLREIARDPITLIVRWSKLR